LENDLNHKILARHIGVDFFSCFIVAYLGIKSAHICKDIWTARHASSSSSTMNISGSEARMFTYHPASQQILLVFLAYQIKNLHDAVMWNDGPEFIFHHIAAGLTAGTAMYPGFGHYYVVFFMGISEISTAILVLLSNFDPKHGVEGFPEAFPAVKIGLGVCFVVSFVACRAIMWPIAAYHFVRDARAVLKLNTPQVNQRRGYIKATMISLTGLSILQVAWLYQIYAIGKAEIEQMLSANNA